MRTSRPTGGLTALFGRSGAGKTSLINVIAGLIRPDQGCVVVDGVTVVDTEQGIFVPVHKRPLRAGSADDDLIDA